MLLPTVLLAAEVATSGPVPNFMDCGGAPVCGVLTLESGFGSGRYQHEEPVVHGLWPQVGKYGNSACLPPRDPAAPTALAGCFRQAETDDEASLAFESYEWAKHGRCAGARDAADYAEQLCGLARAPLAAMAEARRAGLGLAGMADELQRRGMPLWAIDERNSQLELSACAGADGRWRLAAVGEMGAVCDGRAVATSAASVVAEPTAVACLPSARGPQCSADGDCESAPGCVRCARSGFCTDKPLRRP